MWTLIIFIHASILSKGDSVALTNIPNFKTEQSCINAGNKADKLTDLTVKMLKFSCVQQ